MSLASESAQLALWDWDLAKDLVWVEDQGLFGFTPSAPIDHSTLAGSVHPDDRAMREAAIQRALANGGTTSPSFASSCAMARYDGSSRAAIVQFPRRQHRREYSASQSTSRGKSRWVRRHSCSEKSWRIYRAWPR